MTTQVMTRKELILLLALERMIHLATVTRWDEALGLCDALNDSIEAVRLARLET